ARRDVVRMVGVERAGEPAESARDHESDEPVWVGREADGARARLVGFRRADYQAEARIGDAVNEQKRAEQEREAHVIEADGIREIDEPRESAAALEAHAIVAAEHLERDAEVIEHL